MTVEEELLIEMIKGKLTTSRLKNLKILSECLDKYEKKSGVVDYLKSKIHDNMPDDDYETKDEFLSEVENVIKLAEKLASDGETSKALKEMLVLTYFPSFYVDMGHSSFDCRNEYEFFCTCMKYNHCYQTKVHFSYISYLIGTFFVETGDYDKAIAYLQNAVNWNNFNVLARFEMIEALLRKYKTENNNDVMSPDFIKEIRSELNDAHKYIYRADEYSIYMKLIGFILVEEKRYDVAKAAYQFAVNIAKDMGKEDKFAANEILHIEDLTNNHVHFDLNTLVACLKSEAVNFHIDINVYVSAMVYCSNEKADKDLASFIGGNIDLLSDIAGDMEVRLASVRFNTRSEKTYDYICSIEDVRVGDKVLVPIKDQETEATVVDAYWVRLPDLPLEIKKYKEVISIIERPEHNND